jgi:hypothetical protein
VSAAAGDNDVSDDEEDSTTCRTRTTSRTRRRDGQNDMSDDEEDSTSCRTRAKCRTNRRDGRDEMSDDEEDETDSATDTTLDFLPNRAKLAFCKVDETMHQVPPLLPMSANGRPGEFWINGLSEIKLVYSSLELKFISEFI